MNEVTQTPIKKLIRLSAWVIVVVLLCISAFFYFRHTELYPSTDDAYVNANTAQISAQVSGSVAAVYVENNQLVHKGQLLFTIDPRVFQYSVNKAQAEFQLAEKQARAKVRGTAVINANLAVAKASLDQAELNLAHTNIYAPADGYLVNFSVRPGTLITADQPLFALIENQQWWVDANYKETDLARIRSGQTAKIVLASYPDHIFKGLVQSISSGSGSAFSLLPPENATGNWIKVTQRFPVKVLILDPAPKFPLRVGATASVTIDTATIDTTS